MLRRDAAALARQIPIMAATPEDSKKVLKRTAEGLLRRDYPYFTSYKFEPKANGRGENIIFERRGDTIPLEQAEDTKAKQQDLIEQIIEYTSDEKSRAFFTKVVNKFPHQAVYTVLSLTKGYNPKNRGAYCTTLFKEYARDHQIDL